MIIQNQDIEIRLKDLEHGKIQTIEDTEQLEEEESSQLFVNTITKIIAKKWLIKVKLFIKLNFSKEFMALVDSGADPTLYSEKTFQGAVSANTKLLQIDYKILNVHICNKNVCFKTSLLLVKEMDKEIILGTLSCSILSF